MQSGVAKRSVVSTYVQIEKKERNIWATGLNQIVHMGHGHGQLDMGRLSSNVSSSTFRETIQIGWFLFSVLFCIWLNSL